MVMSLKIKVFNYYDSKCNCWNYIALLLEMERVENFLGQAFARVG